MSAPDALGRQWPEFTPQHAGPSVLDAVAKGNAGGTTRDQAKGRLLNSRPQPKPLGYDVYGLMNTLAPGSVPMKQRTRKLN